MVLETLVFHQAGELHARLRYGRTDAIFQTGLHEFLTQVIDRTDREILLDAAQIPFAVDAGPNRAGTLDEDEGVARLAPHTAIGIPHQLQRPAEVGIELADGSTYDRTGRLNFAGSTVDGATGTVQMRAELPNPGRRLLPGQYVRVRVIAGSQQAIVVPQAAVLQNESGRFVWLAGEDGKAVQRPIRAGNWLGGDWVVLEGLKAGDRVIVDNLARLRPGAPVEPGKAG